MHTKSLMLWPLQALWHYCILLSPLFSTFHFFSSNSPFLFIYLFTTDYLAAHSTMALNEFLPVQLHLLLFLTHTPPLKILSIGFLKKGHFLSHIFHVIEHEVSPSWTGIYHLTQIQLNFQVPDLILCPEWSYTWILPHVKVDPAKGRCSSDSTTLCLLRIWLEPHIQPIIAPNYYHDSLPGV